MVELQDGDSQNNGFQGHVSELHGKQTEGRDEDFRRDDTSSWDDASDDEGSYFKYSGIHSTYWFMFLSASIFGLFNVGMDKDGKFKICSFRQALTLIFLLDSIYGFAVYVKFFYEEPLPYWYVIMILPTTICFIYIWSVYLFVFKNSHKIVRYMNALSMIKVKRSWLFYPMMIVLYLFACMVAIPLCLLLPERLRLKAIQPILMSTSVPMIQDIYVTTFVWCLAAGYDALEANVRKVDTWDETKIVDVCNHWINMKKLLDLHNEIFSMPSFHRLLLFTAQAMSYLYTISTFHTSSKCVPLLLYAILFIIELTVRLQRFCRAGEAICCAHVKLTETLTDILHRPSLGRGTRTALSLFVTRLEARPAAVDIWGMDRLGNSSMMHQINIVLTFFVLTIQLRPETDSTIDEDYSELTYFEMCYGSAANGTQSLASFIG